MIVEILKGEYSAVIFQLQFVLIAWAIVVLAIGIDLYYGIQKSKDTGVFIHSYGLRRTSNKVVQYLSLMIFALFFDVLNVFWIYFPTVHKIPIATLLGAIVLVYTEWKSVREKTSEKFRKAIAENPAEIIEFMKANKDMLSELASLALKDKKEDKE